MINTIFNIKYFHFLDNLTTCLIMSNETYITDYKLNICNKYDIRTDRKCVHKNPIALYTLNFISQYHLSDDR